MAFKLQRVPGFADLPDAVLKAEQPALGLEMARIADNASFAAVRPEIFYGRYKHGDTVNLPVSDVDGYPYQRDELLYVWGIYSTVNPATGWISGPGAMWYAGWKVDQNSGLVSCQEFYRKSEGGQQSGSAASTDGVLSVVTIAQRQRSALTVEQTPNYVNVNDSELVRDEPMRENVVTRLNRNAKYAVIEAEVIYCGEFYNGQTIPAPKSPADGYQYSYGESKFLHSWRWTTDGPAFAQPDYSKGQLHRITAQINAATGAVTTQVLMYNSGVITTSWGRVAVFAFCQRNGAQVYQLTVPATAQPFEWVAGGLNSALQYGANDGTPPVKLQVPIREGQTIQISATGSVRMSDARPFVGPDGQAGVPTGTTGGSTGKGFPTKSVVGSTAQLGSLMSVVVDDDGTVIEIHESGSNDSYPAPVGAKWLQFGIDDDRYSDNIGNDIVTVRLGDPVIIGDAGNIPDATGPSVLYTGDELQTLNTWIQPGDVGNSGGGDPNAAPAGFMVPGDIAQFHSTPKYAFNNAFWYLKAGAHNDATDFVMKFDVQIPAAYRSLCRAIEWQIQQNADDWVYNMAWQIDFASGQYRSFTYTGVTGTGHWDNEASAIFNPALYDATAWVSIESAFRVDHAAKTVKHLYLKINGTTYTVNHTRSAIAKVQADYVEPAFQLDAQGAGVFAPYYVNVRHMDVIMATGGTPGIDPGAKIVGPSSGVFAEIADSAFFPGEPDPYTLMQQINANLKKALVRREFFGPASYGNGQTVELPVSGYDGYKYKRSELFYAWEIETTGPEAGNIYDIRFWEFDANVDANGLVSIHEARDATGGGVFNVNEGTLRVVTIGIRDTDQGALFDPDTSLDPRPPDDVPSESGSAGAVVGEIPTGAIDGVNTVFNLSNSPLPPQSLQLFRNGLVLRQGTDYTIAGAVVTLAAAPLVGDWLYAYYRTDGNVLGFNDGVTPSGLINGSNTAYTLPSAPNPVAFLLLYLNGLLEIAGTDYTLSSLTATMGVAPISGDWLMAWSRVDGISADSVSAEVPTGAIDGANTAFTLAATPSPLNSLMLFRNGVLLLPGTDFTLTGNAIAMAVAPGTGDTLVAFYRK
jgi:hypothetical protein